jgi:hypothetical protein
MESSANKMQDSVQAKQDIRQITKDIVEVMFLAVRAASAREIAFRVRVRSKLVVRATCDEVPKQTNQQHITCSTSPRSESTKVNQRYQLWLFP